VEHQRIAGLPSILLGPLLLLTRVLSPHDLFIYLFIYLFCVRGTRGLNSGLRVLCLLVRHSIT
jgi:hypothetical protein